ncbi:MAG: ROK family protein [Defluviitaleaceae bacterium]|nr:ROK family protein [Defluviitaleaceae bacterium]
MKKNYNIGVDLGGTNISLGILNDNFEIIYKDSVKTEKNAYGIDILKQIYNLYKKSIKTKKINEANINKIGIGIPGKCDNIKGIVEYTTNINLTNTNVRLEMSKFTNIPVYIENDANCAAFAESYKENLKNMIMITLGTGIGGGVVLNGNKIGGNIEMGHHIIDTTGPMCGCGNYGCFESHCSATALIKSAKEIAEESKTKILDFCEGDIEKIEAKFIFDAAEQGDEISKKLIDDYIYYLSIGINNLINCYPIDTVVIGGGISSRGEKLLLPLKEKLKKLALGGILKTNIKIATLGNDAGIIGAAMLDAI